MFSSGQGVVGVGSRTEELDRSPGQRPSEKGQNPWHTVVCYDQYSLLLSQRQHPKGGVWDQAPLESGPFSWAVSNPCPGLLCHQGANESADPDGTKDQRCGGIIRQRKERVKQANCLSMILSETGSLPHVSLSSKYRLEDGPSGRTAGGLCGVHDQSINQPQSG